jgi:hypothetical protein
VKILDKQFDVVIDGQVAFGRTTYADAVENLVPLIDKTEFQRKLQDKKFYAKLERDIVDGCVMPPITVALVTDQQFDTLTQLGKFINDNIKEAFVLDGIQRLNTLARAATDLSFNDDYNIYINFVLCDSVEKLLYRMITLNNGQRPMTPRHQVEIMIANVFNFKRLGIEVISEKDGVAGTGKKAFKKADLIQAYLAFMADSPIVDNKKIIEEKMDDLLVGRIMAAEPKKYHSSFKEFILLIVKFQKDADALKWMKIANNLVGFAVGARHSMDVLKNVSAEEFGKAVEIFDAAFGDFNPSRIKVGKYRRELACEFFKNFDVYREYDQEDLLSAFAELTEDE